MTKDTPESFWASIQANPGKPKVVVLPLVRMTPEKRAELLSDRAR